GDADITIFNPSSALSFLQAGDLIPLFVFDDERHPLIPDVLSAQELGLPADFTKLDLVSRFIYAPPNMPEPVAKYYNELMPKVLNDPDFVAWSEKAKRPLSVAGPAEAAKSVKAWVEIYGKYEPQIKAAVKELGG
ncbi:MAG: hypothetical protein ACE5IA_07580, partial [Dehalococcoidia bacterium]